MLIVVVALAVVVGIPLLGGSLAALGQVRLRGRLLLAAGVAAQLGAAAAAAAYPALSRGFHLTSYAALALVLWANRALPRLWAVALGGGLNLVAIAANGGVMPASAAALRAAGLAGDDRFTSSAALPHPRLAVLGDVFATPRWLPLANVFSVGDVILAIGLVLVVHALARRPPGAVIGHARAVDRIGRIGRIGRLGRLGRLGRR
jgi:hypothetical protein